MTPEQRIAAIRERAEAESGPLKYQFYDCARDDITWLLDELLSAQDSLARIAHTRRHEKEELAVLRSENMQLRVAQDAAQLALKIDSGNFEIARAAQSELAALRAVAEAAEGMVAITTVAISRDGYGHFCPWCDAFEVYDDLTHAPECPWQLLQSALQWWKGVVG